MADYRDWDIWPLDDTGLDPWGELVTTRSEGFPPGGSWITNNAMRVDLSFWDDPVEAVAAKHGQPQNHHLPSSIPGYDDMVGEMTWDAIEGSPSLPPSPAPKKQNPRLSKRAVLILDGWLSRHHDAPYPTDEDKRRLQALTGLLHAQINTWFANARKRRKLRSAPALPASRDDAPAPSLPHMGSLHPFERWLELGLEFEPASVAAIDRAITETQKLEGVPAGLREDVDRRTNWQYFGGGPSSVSSLEIRSYAANRSADADQQRLRGFPSLERLERRRTSSARRPHARDQGQRSRGQRNPFQCTFCGAMFARKYEWQRHEKSRHLPLEKWTCTPHGGTAVDPATCDIVCAFCRERDPTPDHLEGHGFAACAQRPLHERTFYRKDHLRQHLRLSHAVSTWAAPMDEWRTEPDMVRSRCGFCDVRLETWPARVDHLADHFSDGASMAQWFGDWGFEPDVLSILEHAAPPHLRPATGDALHGAPDRPSSWAPDLGALPSHAGSASMFECSDCPTFDTWVPSVASGGLLEYGGTEGMGPAPFDAQSLDCFWDSPLVYPT